MSFLSFPKIFQNTIRNTLILLTLVGTNITVARSTLAEPTPIQREDKNKSLEIVHTFADTAPGNIAIAPDGRLFISVHSFYGEPKYRIYEILANGDKTPYPSQQWSTKPDANQVGINNVLGIRVDRDGILWMLDGQSENYSGRLIGWDTKKEQLHQIIYLSKPVTIASSFLNDIAVDKDNNAIYIADSAGAIIVADLNTGKTRRVLNGSKFTTPEDIDMVIDGQVVTLNGSPARIGINPITIDAENKWVYFAPMSSTSLYRLRTADLLDLKLTDEQLNQRVERYGDKTPSDGSTIDSAGNVYITSVTEDAIGVTTPDGSYNILHQADFLSWTDGFAVGADGYIYATVNELHRSPVLNGGESTAQGEFAIVRFKPLAEVKIGR